MAVSDINRPELHASGFRALIEVGEKELGKAVLIDILRDLGTTIEHLKDTTAWFSLEFAEGLMEALVARTSDRGVLDRAMKLMLTPRYLGIVHPLFRSLGTPGFLYGQLPKLVPRVNKVIAWTVERPEVRRALITVRRPPGAPAERTPYCCHIRGVQIAAGPTLFDLPPAQLEHPQCMLRGDEACVYDVRWEEHRRPLWSWVGLLLGIGSSVAIAPFVELPGALFAAVAAVAAVGGWGVGRSYELRRVLQNRIGDLGTVYDALGRASIANEQRYAELLDAKAEVEQKVEQRTRELSEALSHIQEIDRAKTDFFSNVSHELRTPLTLILGPLEYLMSGRDPPGGLQKSVETMQRNAVRLLELITQLLDLAKVDAGMTQLARTPTDPIALARGVEARFVASAGTRNLALVTSVPMAVAPASMDPAWIETALSNFVANALRYARTRVEIRVREVSGSVVFEVEDDGVGIAPDDLPKVFDRFAQGSDASTRKGGTGLGLAIAREAARLHGGEASVRSTQGTGTIFALTLPRTMATAPAPEESLRAPGPGVVTAAIAAPMPAEAMIKSNALPTDHPTSWPGPDPSAPLVLVVEDDDDLRDFVANVLAAQYRVQTARNGEEALALILAARPDAVVSDVAMPRMDGFELCRRLRALDETRSLPVLLLTARRDVGRVLEGFEAGADDYVAKPFHGRELLARLGVQVRLRGMVSEMAHRERLASLGVLAASIAHQVRNPLAALLSGLPAMRRKLATALDPLADEMMGVMIDSASRVERLTVDLLDLSRVDREDVARFKPSDGLQASLRLVESRVSDNVKIETEIDEAIELDGRPGDMNHVFLNLIDNALRAVAPGGTVRVHAGQRAGAFVLEVGDSGPGVDPGRAEWIFGPFATTRPAGEGTGLGLAISRQVVLQHGGTITVGRSDLGGALFVVKLPPSRTHVVAPAVL